MQGSASKRSATAFSNISSHCSRGSPILCPPPPYKLESLACLQWFGRLKSTENDHRNLGALDDHFGWERCHVGGLDAQHKCRRIVGDAKSIAAIVIAHDLSMGFRVVHPL